MMEKGSLIRTAGLFLVLAAVMGALQWNWFAMPLERDEGEYAYSAWLMRTGKGVPYRDSFLQKPPMIIHTYALVEALAPGSNKVGFRVAGFLAALATAGLVWRLGTREFGGRTGLWAAGLWVAYLQQFMMFSSVAANVEKFMVVPMLGAMAVARRGERRGWRWGLAGALGAVAVLYKPICAPVLGVWCAWAMFSGQRTGGGPPAPPGAAGSRTPQGRTSVWRRVGWLALGGAVATVAGVGWFVWKGAMGSLWECAVEFTGEYARMIGNPLRRGCHWFLYCGRWKAGIIWGLAIIGLWLTRRRGGLAWGTMLVVAWLSAMGDMVGGHYYVMALPLAALLGGAAIEGVLKNTGRMGVLSAMVVMAAISMALMEGYEWRALRYKPWQLVELVYGEEPFVAAEGAGRIVEEICPEEGTVHIIGSEPEVLWYARRKGATRFDIVYPLSFPTKFAEKYQLEALEVLKGALPEGVVFVRSLGGFGGMGVLPRLDGYLRAVAEMMSLEGYQFEAAYVGVPDGWVRGGEWEEFAEAGARWGIWTRGNGIRGN